MYLGKLFVASELICVGWDDAVGMAGTHEVASLHAYVLCSGSLGYLLVGWFAGSILAYDVLVC